MEVLSSRLATTEVHYRDPEYLFLSCSSLRKLPGYSRMSLKSMFWVFILSVSVCLFLVSAFSGLPQGHSLQGLSIWNKDAIQVVRTVVRLWPSYMCMCVTERERRRTGGHQMSTDCFHLPGAWSVIPPLCLIKHTHTHTGATRSSLCQPYNSAVYPSGLHPKYFLFREQIKKEKRANTWCLRNKLQLSYYHSCSYNNTSVLYLLAITTYCLFVSHLGVLQT